MHVSLCVCVNRCAGFKDVCTCDLTPVFFFLSPSTCVGNGGESNTDEANCVSSCHSRCCCCFLSWQIWSWLWFCRPPPFCNRTSALSGPTSCSHHGTYPVDRFGFGAAPCTCRPSPRHRRPLLRLPWVLGGVRGERCKRGKGGRRGG